MDEEGNPIPGHFYSQPVKVFDESLAPTNNEGEEVPSKVQLMRTCKMYLYTDANGEDIYDNITKELFEKLKENFDNKVRGIEINVDYYHDEFGISAGWIKGLEIEPGEDGEHKLMMEVEWTPKARQMLSDKEVAYLSSEIIPRYIDPEDKTKTDRGPLLVGAGLTNRPMLKKMESVVRLSEEAPKKEIQSMDEEEKKKLEEEKKRLQAEHDKKMEEMEAKLKKAEEDAQDSKDKMEKQKDMSEREKITSKLFSEGKMTPEQVKEAMDLDRSAFNALTKFAEASPAQAKTSLSGHSNPESGAVQTNQTNTDALEAAAMKLMNEDPTIDQSLPKHLRYSEALKKAASQNLEATKAYYSESCNQGSPDLSHFSRHAA